SQPYFFLVDVAIVATRAGGLLERRRGGPSRPPPPPSRALLGLFLLSTVVSFPLNLREVWLELGLASWPRFLDGSEGAEPWSNLYYLRTVADVATGVGLAALAAGRSWPRALLARLALAATLLYLAVTALGLGWTRLFPPRLF